MRHPSPPIYWLYTVSLDVALGEEILAARREKKGLPAEVEVKIITPPEFARNLPDGFKALLRRHKNVEFVGKLPVDVHPYVVYAGFVGSAMLVAELESSYDRVLACDLDIVFQRNPFLMPMDGDVELLVFGEWRGYKIGHCITHKNWYDGCMSTSQGAFITAAEYKSYWELDRICAGSTYGTAHAMAVYLGLMSAELQRGLFECNDQAIHIHIFYSGKLQEELTARSAGKVKVLPNEEALLRTVGTTPFVCFNEWGEMLSDLAEVQVAVHLFKHHPRLKRYSEPQVRLAVRAGHQLSPLPVMGLDTYFATLHPSAIPG